MNVGGTSNIGPEVDSLGGTILVSQTDGSGLQVYASGLRNLSDLTFTSDGILLASDNAPDGVDSLPPAGLNEIREGKNCGYPDFLASHPSGLTLSGLWLSILTQPFPQGLWLTRVRSFRPHSRARSSSLCGDHQVVRRSWWWDLWKLKPASIGR